MTQSADLPLPAELIATGDEPREETLEAWFENQLQDDAERYTPDEIQAFRVDNPAKGEWTMRKLIEVRHARAELERQRDEWIERTVARANEWFDASMKTTRLVPAENYFTGLLEDYAFNRRVETDGKIKTITLPSGVVRTRENGARLSIADADAALEWAKANLPGALEVRTTLPVSNVKKMTQLVERPVTVLLSPCGHEVFAWMLDRTGLADGVTCPECEKDALVGKWAKTELVAITGDGAQVPVEEGAPFSIEEPSITVTVSES